MMYSLIFLLLVVLVAVRAITGTFKKLQSCAISIYSSRKSSPTPSLLYNVPHQRQHILALATLAI